MEQYFFAGSGDLRISLHLISCGQDWNAVLLGGTHPHIGAVVLAVPRPSLTGCGMSCDCWISPVSGHKDHITACPLAEQLCAASGQTVTVSAGIHIDHATREQLEQIQENCLHVSQQATAWLRQQAKVSLSWLN